MAALWLLTMAVNTSANNSFWHVDTRWGDQGDGTFANPILNADYSDPDVIRVGNKYYMTCSEFHFMGMPILESDDMVNWHVVTHIFNAIDLDGYDTMSRYAGGTWAPTLREHDGRFYMFVCTPAEGLLMSVADDIRGPWEPLHVVKQVSGWEDPCPFWDDDGQAYLGRSQHGAGPIIIHKMSTDGRQLLDDGREVYRGPVAEGTKLFKRDGYYYLSIPEGGVGTGWQQVLRSKSIYGPYEGKTVLERGATKVNGPHQGALVDTPDGAWWFFHFQSTEPLGRVVHLQPVEWRDGFPFIGTDNDNNGIGEPMKICRKPIITGTDGRTDPPAAPCVPQGSDTFDHAQLHPMWQWNHNPDNSHWSLTDHPGCLKLIPSTASDLRKARNTLTQKLMGYSGEAIVKLNYATLKDNARAGMACLGKIYAAAGICLNDGKCCVYWEQNGQETIIKTLEDTTKSIYLRLDYDAFANRFCFSYSLTGETFLALGDSFSEASRDWKGARVALYAYTKDVEKQTADGAALFDAFVYLFDGPLKQHESK